MNQRVWVVGILCMTFVNWGILGCSMLQPAHVADASKKRDVICQFVDVWAKDQPDLRRVDELCEAGADLKEIAAAYAGCHKE